MQKPQSCLEMLAALRREYPVYPLGEKLVFHGVGNKDVYNITAPFVSAGETVIAGRTEPREDGLDSETVFFTGRTTAGIRWKKRRCCVSRIRFTL